VPDEAARLGKDGWEQNLLLPLGEGRDEGAEHTNRVVCLKIFLPKARRRARALRGQPHPRVLGNKGGQSSTAFSRPKSRPPGGPKSVACVQQAG